MSGDLTSRQRGTAAVAMACDDGHCCGDHHHRPLAESSVSTDAEEQDKYNKSRRRIKKERKLKKDKKSPSAVVIVGVFAIFLFVLIMYHVFVKTKRDRRRHAKLMYERAQTILQNLDKRNHHHAMRRKSEEGGGGGIPGGHHPQGRGNPSPGWPQLPGYPRQSPPKQDDDDDKKDEPNQKLNPSSNHEIEESFAHHRLLPQSAATMVPHILKDWIKRWDEDIRSNVNGGIRWIRPYLLPGMDDLGDDDHRNAKKRNSRNSFFDAFRTDEHMSWHDEWDQMVEQHGGVENIPGPMVDYTDPDKYKYPPLMEEPPSAGGYPQMTTLGDMLKAWDQDEDNEDIIHETLLHFDFSNPRELEMAGKFRDAMLPFKLYNVPEVSRATELWTDDYVAKGFGAGKTIWNQVATAHGTCQESVNHYFAFFTPPLWKPERMGVPPVRNNDLHFDQWAKHARYADAARLAPDQPHFYWQSGVDKTERHKPQDQWSFISRDLPSFSATEPNFIMFNPDEQKGIQCRFGERGVVAATHYDSGRNMVGMITGAKRYILSPPNACGKLGIFPDKNSPIFRHSLLNFGHIKYLNDPEKGEGMSDEEREWLERAATAPAVETVLKAGEVLYIPSFWFHYIVSVQKSAQCNARSGVETDRHWEFGGAQDVKECVVE
uniref:JmjC domain-containing protein n=1 Tax=Amphora coffeiformis TaxID=265554 RepID=A0A7S3L462_9STRA|mmetsp:Transcript_18018/g.34116  ORF Transcript_18018/g.34116 Transcript_18018/m.34116 type:complete len:658 (+) Transcript_18018:165-2138(+)|eukprot:scaffold1663_cov171-Amphora_coffeaeformis.AAC.19